MHWGELAVVVLVVFTVQYWRCGRSRVGELRAAVRQGSRVACRCVQVDSMMKDLVYDALWSRLPADPGK